MPQILSQWWSVKQLSRRVRNGLDPESVPRHGHACDYGSRRPSGLSRHNIKTIEVATSDTADSPTPGRDLIIIQQIVLRGTLNV